MTRRLGWTYPLHAEPWPQIERTLAALEARNPAFGQLRAIAASVRERSAEDDLAGATVSHDTDLLVRSTPVPDPPFDVVAVRTNESVRQVRIGTWRQGRQLHGVNPRLA